jgi:hypothetical protein
MSSRNPFFPYVYVCLFHGWKSAFWSLVGYLPMKHTPPLWGSQETGLLQTFVLSVHPAKSRGEVVYLLVTKAVLLVSEYGRTASTQFHFGQEPQDSRSQPAASSTGHTQSSVSHGAPRHVQL